MNDAQPSNSVVLVCTGWRKMHLLPYAKAAAFEWFDYVEKSHGPIVQVVEGGAKGADTLCRKEAERRGIPVETIPADWKQYGKRAGMLRNQAMVDYAKEQDGRIVGLAFLAPQSKGTVDMVSRMLKERWWVEKVHLPNTEMVA
jgi:hypothetical protein